MPELPEVEIVTRGLKRQINGETINRVWLNSPKIRNIIPKNIITKFRNKTINEVNRRAKYIIIQAGDNFILSHLGMTGNWRIEREYKSKKHDHVLIEFNSGKTLIYNDPRRFGVFDWSEDPARSPWLTHLGPEPLDKKSFHIDYLFPILKKSKSNIKTLIMNQKIVVGVGNIYACEALFTSGIRPIRPAHRVTKKECATLISEIQAILKSAIKQGGSTIKDFKSAGGWVIFNVLCKSTVKKA